MREWRIWLAAISTLAIVIFAIYFAFNFNIEREKPIGMKQLSGTVAEGFVYRSGKERFPRATCDACRVGKMKMGVISIGALNTLEFDNLTINIPESVVPNVCGVSDDDKNAAVDIVDGFDLKPLLSAAQSGKKKAFASIKINKLALNKMRGTELRPIFSADVLKSRGKDVVLRGVTIYREQNPQQLSHAELVIKPRIVIQWDCGSWDITDVIRRGQSF